MLFPVYVKNQNLEYSIVNDAFCEYLGLNRKALIGNTCEFYMKPNDWLKTKSIDLAILKSGTPYKNENVSSIKQKGSNMIIYKNRFTVQGAHFIIGKMIDVTNIKSLESSLKLKNQKLEEYIKTNNELENFAYYASHDLKSPLQNILNYSNLFADSISHKLSDQEKTYLDFILNGTKRMKNTVEALLNFSLSINQKLELRNTNIFNLVNDLLADINFSLKSKESELEIDSLPTCVYCDPEIIRNVFQNLISNAIKFVGKGKKPKVKISSINLIDRHVFSISDNGIGIPKDKLNEIFEIFKKLNLQNEYPGTGIGLSFCKKAIEKHDGEIWLESELGKGTTFFFSIPKR